MQRYIFFLRCASKNDFFISNLSFPLLLFPWRKKKRKRKEPKEKVKKKARPYHQEMVVVVHNAHTRVCEREAA